MLHRTETQTTAIWLRPVSFIVSILVEKKQTLALVLRFIEVSKDGFQNFSEFVI